MEIRDCMPADLNAVSEIENASFDEPYPLGLFVHLLKIFPQGFRVAILENIIVGYCVISPLKLRRVLVLRLPSNPSRFQKSGCGLKSPR